MKEKFDIVNDIVLYDPILSPIERTTINELGCTVLHDNEFGKRTVHRPTIFFMPNCPFYFHDNVLRVNWTPANLNKIIVLSYTFQTLFKIFQMTILSVSQKSMPSEAVTVYCMKCGCRKQILDLLCMKNRLRILVGISLPGMVHWRISTN